MRAIRKIFVPVEKECEILFRIRCNPICYDPHFAPGEPFYVKQDGEVLYFENEEDAKATIKKLEKEYLFVEMEIEEKITPIS
jgi:hypothetical protein